MLENDGEKREFQTPGTFKLLDWDSTVLFRPSVHVTRHSEKKVFFFIRLKSKEKFSAISA